MDDITQSSLDTSKNVNNLSTQIEGLIDALTKLQTPVKPVNAISTADSKTTETPSVLVQNSDSYSEDMLNHDTGIINFFSQAPFYMSIGFISDFLLPRYDTVNSIFFAKTLSLHSIMLITQLHRMRRLDDYENMEEDLIVYFAFIQYLQTYPEGPLSLTYFDPKDFSAFLCEQYFTFREKLVDSVTKLRNIKAHNTRVSTVKYRENTKERTEGDKHKPKVEFGSSVQGGYKRQMLKLLTNQKTLTKLSLSGECLSKLSLTCPSSIALTQNRTISHFLHTLQ